VLTALIGLFSSRGQKIVDPIQTDVTGFEGGIMTFSCIFRDGGSSPDLFWYIQRHNSVPRFILRRDTYSYGDNGTEFNQRFYSKLNNSASSVPLTIQNLQVSDSAVYYCALRPTVHLHIQQ
uniref:Ig-like domain-containing protein n=1 Tax=Denticeps clupeoides TaxID=299321 RepID=A0AAY4ACQ9_9TELE